MLPEGIYEQMIVYKLLSFWIAGSRRGRKTRTESKVSLFCSAHRLPVSSPNPQLSVWISLMVHTLSQREESENEEPVQTLETLLLSRSAALSPDCVLPVLFSRLLHLLCPIIFQITTQRAIFILLYTSAFSNHSFSTLQLHRLDINATILG